MKRKRSLIVLTVVVITGLAPLGFMELSDQERSASFQTISSGMSKNEVIAIMGEPNEVLLECLDPIEGLICSSELQYDSYLLPRFWTVAFDDEDRVISKYAYVSP